MHNDTSHTRDAVDSLLWSQRRLGLALRAAGAGAWEWNMATNETLWSVQNYALLGLPVGDGHATYDEWLACVHPDDRDAATEEVRRAVGGKGDLDFEYRVVWPDGSVHWLRDVGRMMLDEAGEAIGMFGIQMDVTEKRALEQRLLSAEKLEALGLIAAAVAHDFNNLLTVISGHTELLRTSVSNRDAPDSTEEILRSVARAAELTNQLLAFGRRQTLHFEVLDLNVLVLGVERLIVPLFGETIQVTNRLLPDPLLVRADPGQLEQVLLNLAVNARDAMPSGGRVVIETAKIERDGESDRWAALTITDTGVGMDDATIERIFDPFFSTKHRDKGSGLGLASAYGIIRQSGGEITVESTPGEGSRFTVQLPLVEGSTATASLPSRSAAPADQGGIILLVEDNAAIRRLVRTVLTRQGYEVVAASTAEEALTLLGTRSEPIHLLMTDVVLPGVSGPELAEQVRRLQPGVGVLFVTGYSEEVLSARGAPGEPPALLTKPFSHKQLLQKVREALVRGRTPGATAPPTS